MYNHRKSKITKTSLNVNESYEGETIEMRLQRAKTNQEPIGEEAPIIFTERKDGVKPEHDIRTSKMELAVDAMDIHSRNKLAKREEKLKAQDDKAKAELKAEMDKNETKTGGQST